MKKVKFSGKRAVVHAATGARIEPGEQIVPDDLADQLAAVDGVSVFDVEEKKPSRRAATSEEA